MSTNFLIQSVEDRVKIIKFNRPSKKNALNIDMYLELTRILNEDAHNDDIVVTVLTGAGDYYTSGNDIVSAMNINPDEDFEEMVNKTNKIVHDFVAAIINYPKLLIAIVNGPAIGIGVTTLGLCDVVYASDVATFSTPFVNLGLCPEGCSSYLFSRIMGTSRASEMLLLGTKLTAQEAFQCGLVSKVFPLGRINDIFNEVMKYGSLPINSMKRAKKLMRNHMKEKLHEINTFEMEELKQCYGSTEMLEALTKFTSRKRTPTTTTS